jgi:hypothetical protein
MLEIKIISRAHALAAAFRAVNDLIERRLRSRNVHSEVVFSLSPNSNVCQVFGTAPHSLSTSSFRCVSPTFYFYPSLFSPSFICCSLYSILDALSCLLVCSSFFRLLISFPILGFGSKIRWKISESFRRFGITPSTTSLLVIKISTPEKPVTAAAVQDHLKDSVKGTQVPFDDEALKDITDWAKVNKYYKLGAAGPFKGGVIGGERGSGEQHIKEVELQVLGAMALRGAS